MVTVSHNPAIIQPYEGTDMMVISYAIIYRRFTILNIKMYIKTKYHILSISAK